MMEGARPSAYTEGPNDSGYFTAGIDLPASDNQFHDHAIEFHSKHKAEAERRRDFVLAAILLVNTTVKEI